MNSVKCMRGAFHALDEGELVPYSTAAFEAYWGDDRDIAREDVLADIATGPVWIASASSPPSRPTPASRSCAPTQTS